ncbi:MAG: nucleotidyl transferase AbiEii/AbiGii toxin family protein [Salinivirgaceae bacterium]|jgi:hypothetical protein|nr:nucleotidyl transferase AbiEii/AbiGii toxin family protein [Salinivirgaceae bacterium]
MLFYKTVGPKTLELLKSLQKIPELDNLILVGGPALALQFGHRTSIDIDLFGKLKIDTDTLVNILQEDFELNLLKKTKHMFIATISGIKVDIINYSYPWIDKCIKKGNIKLAGPKDIAAMKLSAITGKGSKKDFIDLFLLLKQFTLEEMLNFYTKKYSDGSQILVLKSLTYFEDAEDDIAPKMFTQYSWDEIKQTTIGKVSEYIQK